MYDYTCPLCSHEFDYDEGIKGYEPDKYMECSHCNSDITDNYIDNEEAHNNS